MKASDLFVRCLEKEGIEHIPAAGEEPMGPEPEPQLNVTEEPNTGPAAPAAESSNGKAGDGSVSSSVNVGAHEAASKINQLIGNSQLK